MSLVSEIDLKEPRLLDEGHELLDLLPIGICVFDRNLTIRSWNRTLADWTGVAANEIVGQRLDQLYSRLDSLRFRSRIQQVFETLSPVILSPALHKYFIPVQIEGDEQRMMVQRTTLRPFNRQGTLAMAMIEDVTITHRQLDQLRSEKLALLEANKKVEDYAELLSKSNKELEQFASVASHDLQEPLRKISTYCQLLAEEQGDRLDEEGRAFLDVAIDGANRLSRLVKDLLVFSRVTTHGKPLEPTEAQECLRIAIADLEFAIQDSHATITHDPLPEVLAEQGQLIQLFQNLLGNAIKYCAASRPVVHIGVKELKGNVEGYEFSVADNGIGIESRFHERVFEVFQRLHSRSEYEGTGIGLAVCKRIVERFGGEIRIESEIGSGSTFLFTLKNQEAETRACKRASGSLSKLRK